MFGHVKINWRCYDWHIFALGKLAWTIFLLLPITPIIATPNTEINPASFGRPMSSVDFFCGIRPPLLSTGPTPNNPANNITVIIYSTFPFILKLSISGHKKNNNTFSMKCFRSYLSRLYVKHQIGTVTWRLARLLAERFAVPHLKN